jgi:hypothetical protein
MRILPTTKDEWLALALFPFKAYVVVAFPLLKLFGAWSATIVHTHYNRGETTFTVSALYLTCILALLLGALIQWLVRCKNRAIQTLVFAVNPR